MSSKRGEKRLFDSGVIIAILTGKKGYRALIRAKVDMGDVAEVNEHLFPNSGRCSGLLIGRIAITLSKPEILRQVSKLNGVDVMNTPPGQLKKILGKIVPLTCTGR